MLAGALAVVQVLRGIGRLDDPDPHWAVVSFGLAALLVGLVVQMERRRRELPGEGA